MANTLITKNSSTAAAVPTAGQLVQGELAVNVTDKRVFTENAAGAVVELGVNPSSVTTGALAYTGTLTGGTGVVNIGSGQVYKDASGNLGIGTSSPAYKLEVQTGTTSAALWAQTGGTTSGHTITDFRTGTNASAFATFGDTSSVWQGGGMTLSAGGNLLVGTTSAVGKLVIGATGGTNFISMVDNANGGVYGRLVYDNNYFIYKPNSGVAAFTVDPSGNFLVGTTTNTDFGTALTVVSAGARVVSAKGTGGSSTWVSSIWNTGTSGTRNLVQFFTDSGQSRGDITSNGTGVSYNTSSDYRLKEDWVAVADASTRVNALKPVNFAWKANGSRVDGFLAHELADVVPEAVTGVKDAVDAEGKPVYQGIDQSKLVPLLTAALQEALAAIESLTARISALES